MPCKPRMVGCRFDCGHRALVDAYRSERIRQEDEAEAVSNGWATEYAEYVAEHPLITFKEWLLMNRGPQHDYQD